jgi:predicted transcriptional regulator
MTTFELKKRIIDRIQQIENEDLLKETSRLIELEMEDIESPYELSREMIDAVEEAQEQIKKSEFLDHKDANKEIDKWLDE